MSQVKTGQLEDYVKRMGEHINAIYAKINEINKKMKEIEDAVAKLRDESANNADAVSNLRENTVQKAEFDEFVSRLTESLRDLLPPLPTGAEEAQKERQ